jgi:hypothetical protein
VIVSEGGRGGNVDGERHKQIDIPHSCDPAMQRTSMSAHSACGETENNRSWAIKDDCLPVGGGASPILSCVCLPINKKR